MTQLNEIPAGVVLHYTGLHKFLESGLIPDENIDFVHMEIAMIERDFPGIKEAQ
ncbi:hypothetical protein ACI2LM_15695 [Paenibacillus lautus]|uniref:hypothetical protein n=1 Tax=Paenibacillus lautus TaxID=1401 RepID=UPI00384A52CD